MQKVMWSFNDYLMTLGWRDVRGMGPPGCQVPPHTPDLALRPVPPPGPLPFGPSLGEYKRGMGGWEGPGDPDARRGTETLTQVRVRDTYGTKVSAGGNCKKPKHPEGEQEYGRDPGVQALRQLIGDPYVQGGVP